MPNNLDIKNLMSEVVDEKILPLIDSMKLEIVGYKDEHKKELSKVNSRLEDIENDLDGVDGKLTRIERVLERAQDRYDDKLNNHEKRLVTVERARPTNLTKR